MEQDGFMLLHRLGVDLPFSRSLSGMNNVHESMLLESFLFIND